MRRGAGGDVQHGIWGGAGPLGSSGGACREWAGRRSRVGSAASARHAPGCPRCAPRSVGIASCRVPVCAACIGCTVGRTRAMFHSACSPSSSLRVTPCPPVRAAIYTPPLFSLPTPLQSAQEAVWHRLRRSRHRFLWPRTRCHAEQAFTMTDGGPGNRGPLRSRQRDAW